MSKKEKNVDTSSMSLWSPKQPYNALPKLPPALDLETRAVLKQCVTARTALGELKQAADLIPNPSVLINTLPVLEAQASSEIENIVTTADELFRHLRAEDATDPATKEALRYREALIAGLQAKRARPIGTRTAESICSRIRGVEMTVRKVPGTVLTNSTTGEIIYTPPVGEALLRDLLANWERFLHAQGPLDPLVQMALAHYQFEAIHPFTDGNGRTGRVLNSLFLVEKELLGLPILYLSRYIIANKTDYYRLLLDVTRKGDWEPWVLYLVKGVEETAIWTRSKIAAMRDLANRTAEHTKRALPKIYSHELVDLIFEQPYCRIGDLVRAKIAMRQTASNYLKALVGIGVLREETAGRSRLFVHLKLMKLLTQDSNEFAPYE
jgi:Fic family protein